ncbi:MAG: AraC family transcriptional regulator [Bacteroidetes bacterium]|nr:MAG: AraC family transcriptional regulator [Bacteroidota bacterium]
MRFEFGFYSSLLLIFFVHTLVYSFLSFRKYFQHGFQASLWLSLFLLLSALYIAPWMLGFAGWYASQPYRDFLFYMPFQHLFLIAPSVYFYVQSLLNPAFRFHRQDFWHFLPALAYIAYSVLMVVYDKWVVGKYYFLLDERDRDFDTWYQFLGFVSMIVYFALSLRYYNSYKRLVVQVVSNAQDVAFVWVRNFLIAFLCLLVAWLALAFFEAFFQSSYTKVWWYFFSYAIICYYIAIEGYANVVQTKVFFKINLLQPQHTLLLLPSQKTLLLEAYQETETIDLQIDTDTATNLEDAYTQWKNEIENLIIQENLYQDAELSLPQLAQKLHINIPLLSKIINKGFGLNFNDFINQYRIKAVITCLQAGKHKTHTLLGIAFECGFNSKTTFNRAFKKQTSLSPQEYIKKNMEK